MSIEEVGHESQVKFLVTASNILRRHKAATTDVVGLLKQKLGALAVVTHLDN